MEIIKPINRDDWVDADPANNIPGAIPPAKAFAQTMAEMVNVIESAGLTPSGEDLTQFDQAIKALVQMKVDEANLLAVSNTVYQRNVGDFFFTENMTKGTKATGSLNGGYECNGDEFSADDFSGDSDPFSLLVAGHLPSCSYDEYAQSVADFGSCGKFALDTEARKFKVPTAKDRIFLQGIPGELIQPALPNITGEFASGANYGWGETQSGWSGAFKLGYPRGGTGERRGTGQFFGLFDASLCNPIYGAADTVRPAGIGARVMVQLANEIDNATSVEKYLTQIKDAQKAALAAVQTAVDNLSAQATQALADIEADKTAAVTAVNTAKDNALTALQALYDSSIADIQTEIADLKQYVDETVEPLYDAFDAVVDKSDTNIVTLTDQNTLAEQNIAALTPLNDAAAEILAGVTEKADAAAASAAAAQTSQTAAETAVSGFDNTVAVKISEAEAALDTAKDAAIKSVEASADNIKAAVDAAASAAEQATTTAENAQNTANSVVAQLEGFSETVATAKTEITTLAGTEKTGIETAANTAQTTAVTAIDSAKTGAVAEIEAAGEVIASYQQPIIALTATSGTIALEVNKIYNLSITAATTFSLPTPSNTEVFNQIKVMLRVTGTPTITWGTSQFFNKATPEIEAGSYDCYFDYDNLLGAWVAGVMPKGAAE